MVLSNLVSNQIISVTKEIQFKVIIHHLEVMAIHMETCHYQIPTLFSTIFKQYNHAISINQDQIQTQDSFMDPIKK